MAVHAERGKKKNYPHRGAVVIGYLGLTEHTGKNVHLICKITELILFSKFFCASEAAHPTTISLD